jgi:2-polyprenyl-3-methyl-5-hydroxy-6-metoxy-1,4-benzoquinol methylase
MLDEFYSRYFAEHRRAEFDLHRRDRLLVREMRVLNPLSDEKFGVLERLHTMRGLNVLDVGFGMGQSLLLLRSLGATVTGIDPDPDALEFARTVLGITSVECVGLLQYRPTLRYDAVIMHDLIEHPLEPLTFLRKARALLAPGGLLSIWTPNATRALAEDDPLLFRLDLEHMQYLTLNTCRYLARRLSLNLIHCVETGQPRLARTSLLDGRAGSPWRVRRAIRRSLALIPGIERLTNLRRTARGTIPSEGSYHLFCVFQRPV